jgi:hypothetical protein
LVCCQPSNIIFDAVNAVMRRIIAHHYLSIDYTDDGWGEVGEDDKGVFIAIM